MPDDIPIPPPPPLPDFGRKTPEEWRKKIKVHRDILNYYKTASPDAPLQEQIRMLAMRGTMARAGGIRTGTLPEEGPKQEFWIDLYRPTEQVKYLAEAFDYETPESGSVFWSGVDANKLVGQVRDWNKQPGSKDKFGQLEATTDARFLNGAFEYRDAVQGYWSAASKEYGKAALGHVTSVQVFGIRKATIFWKEELREILNGMNAKLAVKQIPDVIDITIVVLEPVGLSSDYVFYTNLDIAKAYFYGAKPGLQGYPKKRADCVTEGQVGQASIPYSVREFWAARGSVKPSPAALKIAAKPSAVRYG